MREQLLLHCIRSLQSNGFETQSFFDQNSCFDIAARRGKDHILVKVLHNIDSIRLEQAMELKQISSALEAIPIIVGEKSKHFSLDDGVWYERYDIPVASDQTFSKSIRSSIPFIKYFKGKKTAELDLDKLRQKIAQSNQSLKSIAIQAGVRSETLYRYEHGFNPSLEAAQRLEKALKGDLIKRTDLFEEFHPSKMDWFNQHVDDTTLRKIQRLGIKLAMFDHAPFRAFANPGEGILIDESTGDNKELERKALSLQKSKKIFETHAMLLTKDSKKESVEHTPIIQEKELLEMKKGKQLLKLLKEREEE